MTFFASPAATAADWARAPAMQEIPIADAPRRVRNFLAPTENIEVSSKTCVARPGKIPADLPDLQNKISSRQPADRLAELRAQMRALKEEEERLRLGFISGDLPLEGDDYVVVAETKANERLDLKAMRQHVQESIWAPYLIATPSSYVKTERKRDAHCPAIGFTSMM